jgi:hypothetical protein
MYQGLKYTATPMLDFGSGFFFQYSQNQVLLDNLKWKDSHVQQHPLMLSPLASKSWFVNCLIPLLHQYF